MDTTVIILPNKFIIKDVIVIGAGGAGLFCGIQAAALGHKTLLLDHAPMLGRKILISGGGRCNFTNIYAEARSYVCRNPHFVKSALSRYTPGDFIELIEKHGIPYHEKKLGQLFCDRSAQDIVTMLEKECQEYGALIKLNQKLEYVARVEDERWSVLWGEIRPDEIKSIESQVESSSDPEIKEKRFAVKSNGKVYWSKNLVVATGGLSVPKVGATDLGYCIAREAGHRIIETEPALDGFVFSERDKKKYGRLYGISCDTILKVGETAFRENILFTHLGLSGPASLQGSLYWREGDAIEIDFCPDLELEEYLIKLRKSGTRKILKSVICELLPNRLAERLLELEEESLTDKKVAELSNSNLEKLSEHLKRHKIKPVSTVGFVKAEVTRGGVDTDGLSSKSMESKIVPGLYFIGEVVDVTGQLGGFNFQWAWSSAYAAATSLEY